MPLCIGTLLATYIFVCKFTLFSNYNKILNEKFDFLTFFKGFGIDYKTTI